MLEFLYTLFWIALVLWLAGATLLALWGWRNGSRVLPSLLAGLLLGPFFGALFVWWRGRLHQWRKRWRTGIGEHLCTVSQDGIYCQYRRQQVDGGNRASRRAVFWQLPDGPAPATGWPSVLLFHGTAHPAQLFFGAQRNAPYGGYEQTRAVMLLLDAGYAVIAPDAWGRVGWLTNLPPFSRRWSFPGNPDRRFIKALFAAMDADRFGRLDPQRRYAAGISSGGYMTSRMAVSYPGRFRALAIAAASYATCLGRYCRVPSALAAGHPPTLFIHGGRDRTVPIATMQAYRAALDSAGIPTRLLTDKSTGHAWLNGSGEAMLAWFEGHA